MLRLMGMTAVEKVLARTAGCSLVRPGDVVQPTPDFIMIHDGLVRAAKRELEALGIDRLATPEKVVMVTDHEVIYGSARAAEFGVINRNAAKAWGVGRFFDVGRGGHGHIFPMESGMLSPGMFYFDNDRHSTNAGAIGAFGFRMGAEISRVLATGTNWVSVPRTVKIALVGKLKPHVYARDIGFYLARLVENGALDFDFDYRVVEFAGDIDQFGLSERTALCNSPTELGAYGVFFPPSESILEFAQARAQQPFAPVFADADAQYEHEAVVNIGALEPQVVLPGSIQTSVDVSEAVGQRIDHAFLGACGSGMYEDFVVAASFLRGRRLPDHVRLFVAPGTEASTRRMSTEGLIDLFLQAGAILLPAGCGPCNDAVVGPVHDGEVSISTASNSNAGRFGSKKARLYLGSPATVAASAVSGAIVDPRNLAVEPS